MTREELDTILEIHKKWLRGEEDGRRADLRGAYLQGAYLRGADLQGALNILYPIACPEKGSFTAFKKVFINIDDNTSKCIVCELLIPDSAKRSSATSRKCRADKAKVVAFYDVDGNELDDIDEAFSSFDSSFIYKKGEVVEVKDFELNRWNECAPGIHFFLSFDEAKNY